MDIGKEFDNFFEFDTADKSQVSSTSCKLFAEHVTESLRNQLAECKKDAERYRYLKTDTNMQFNIYNRLEVNEIDAAIDEMIAMREKGE